ncbi:MAG: hypothetical protein FWE08_06900 [Oscillospiraceae bacterium]|nr:hypothetical protein [Oscillospiraceae bacterium]
MKKKVLTITLIVFCVAVVGASAVFMLGNTVTAAETPPVDLPVLEEPEVCEPIEAEDEPDADVICEAEAVCETAQAEFWAWHWDEMTAFWLAYYEANRPEPVEVADDAEVALIGDDAVGGTEQGTPGTPGTGATNAPPTTTQTPSTPPANNNNSGGSSGGVVDLPMNDSSSLGENQFGGQDFGWGGSGCFWDQ